MVSFGAGMLALPYAFEQGGLIVGLLGLGVVLAWNQSCCQLLVDLGEELTARLKSDPTMPTERTTYAAVGLMAMGKPGAWLVNSSVVVTLLGAATAYLITANIMLKDTPLYAGHSLGTESATYLNTLIYMILMYPLTLARSLAPLANLSVPAILGLFGGFAVILTLGIRRFALSVLFFYPKQMHECIMYICMYEWCTSLEKMLYKVLSVYRLLLFSLRQH
ncbi:unnamed protein product [Choristocarpus tenellus]